MEVMEALKSLLEHIETLTSTKKGLKIIAIDGYAASGKTTLASSLAEHLRCSVIHMDDFFLPKYLRTKERLESAGGNVHYERFKTEVIDHLADEVITYQRFDCSTMDFGDTVSLKLSDWLVIEGSYSCHPYFKAYMDLFVFVEIDHDLQIERIGRRNGTMMLKRFIDTWIPMENQYFETYDIKSNADCIIEGHASGVSKWV